MVGTPRAHPGMVLTCDTKAVPSDVGWLLISTWYMLIQHSLRRISARRCQTEEVEGCTHKYKTIDPPSSCWLFHLELSGAAGKGFNTVWDKQTRRSSPSFCQYLGCAGLQHLFAQTPVASAAVSTASLNFGRCLQRDAVMPCCAMALMPLVSEVY